MKYLRSLMIALALAGVVLAGCSGGDQENKADDAAGKASADAAALCGKCGLVKDSDECCKLEGKEICDKCGLVKDSPGCCLPGVESGNVSLCTKCGEVKGSDECCKTEGKEICGMCGLIKGSPGCCKIK